MARQTQTARPEGVLKAKTALASKQWTHQDLAEAADIKTRTPISKFLSGKRVESQYFIWICEALGLEWQDIAEPLESPQSADFHAPPIALESVVQQVRQQIQPYIQERCSKMRVLDMEQSIALGTIYTEVNILERVSGHRGMAIADLLATCNLGANSLNPDFQQFDRFGMGRIREERVDGLKAVQRHRKLLVLGKPGAGKTTFLKRLAVLCSEGKLHEHRVPIFVTLKEFAEAEGKPDLQTYLTQSIDLPLDLPIDLSTEPIDPPVPALPLIWQAGKALVLLDGLDEVRQSDHGRVTQQIRDFSDHFPDNQFVMTCRIAAQEYTFESFTEVEMADFNRDQIRAFVGKWFKTKQDSKKAESFLDKLKGNPPIEELAKSPLLLTLLCLLFGEAAEFPANRSELYEEALEVLLRKWDAKRNIERDRVYKKLSRQRKEDLLSQLAYRFFERGEYFSKQREVTAEIVQFIRNLPGASEDEADLELDGAAVLRSIESQHGLLMERARNIYSFSHLTFLEYFVARQIKEQGSEAMLQALVSHLTEPRWREVFLLTVGMLLDSDRLFQLMKQQIDGLGAEDPKIQQFLSWVEQKSQSVDAPYKPAAVRAYYFDRDLARARARVMARDRDRDFAQDLARALARDRALARAIDRTLARDLARDRARALARDRALALALARSLAFARALARDLTRNRDLVLDRARALARSLSLVHALAIDLDLDPELQSQIEQLKGALPTPSTGNREAFREWWQKHGLAWRKELRTVMIQHRNIGTSWQFSNEQEGMLQQYYDANLLLVQCLNLPDIVVTRSLRQEIEETLLLPIAHQTIDRL